MKMKITQTAADKLKEKISGKEGYLKLKYDIDGCGCAVNGVAALWLESEQEQNEIEIETNGLPVLIEKAKEVFFDEQMTLDYSAAAGCFQLKSSSEYLNPRMSFFDKTNA